MFVCVRFSMLSVMCLQLVVEVFVSFDFSGKGKFVARYRLVGYLVHWAVWFALLLDTMS